MVAYSRAWSVRIDLLEAVGLGSLKSRGLSDSGTLGLGVSIVFPLRRDLRRTGIAPFQTR